MSGRDGHTLTPGDGHKEGQLSFSSPELPMFLVHVKHSGRVVQKCAWRFWQLDGIFPYIIRCRSSAAPVVADDHEILIR